MALLPCLDLKIVQSREIYEGLILPSSALQKFDLVNFVEKWNFSILPSSALYYSQIKLESWVSCNLQFSPSSA